MGGELILLVLVLGLVLELAIDTELGFIIGTIRTTTKTPTIDNAAIDIAFLFCLLNRSLQKLKF
jgi:hypothetical protein